MKSLSHFLNVATKSVVALFAAAMFLSSTRAADTDLFITGAGGQPTRPNVLIIIDNTGNWTKPFPGEQRALAAVLEGLEPGLFNVGLMMFAETGSPNDNNDGGYVRFAIRPMDNKDNNNGTVENATESIIDTVKRFTEGADRGNAPIYGLVMAEAYNYFARRVFD